MLLILASSHDREAQSAVVHFGPQQAAILGAEDLSRPGWKLDTAHPGHGTVVASGNLIDTSDIDAILIRRLAVYPEELTHVCSEDRSYVAAEMTALLTWWLTVTPIPVLNRPARGSLCGPGLRPQQWRKLAHEMGFVTHTAPYPDAPDTDAHEPYVEVSVVAAVPAHRAPVGPATCVAALARATGCGVLAGIFTPAGALVSAHPFPRLTPDLLDAIAPVAAAARCSQ